MSDRTCCICEGDPDCRHDVLTLSGRPTGVTYYFCEVHGNDIDDWIAAEQRKVFEEEFSKEEDA